MEDLLHMLVEEQVEVEVAHQLHRRHQAVKCHQSLRVHMRLELEVVVVELEPQKVELEVVVALSCLAGPAVADKFEEDVQAVELDVVVVELETPSTVCDERESCYKCGLAPG